MNPILSTLFAECVVSFCIGILFGFILHGIVRAPRWLVQTLAE